ncbi:DUF368 domain-containing protein [Nocardioidaceae bacterium]|nr:DUF368 domain-containing protein [Nocardioidaceae bacterium]
MAETPPPLEQVESPSRSRKLLPLDLLRGFLIGCAELVPGVSGGTVALVVGVYDQLIDSASHVLGALRRLVTGPDRVAAARVEVRRTDWWLIVPVLLGMATAVVTIAGLLSGFVSGEPELARGLFFGLVAVSVVVPLRMLPAAHRPPWVDALVAVASAVVAFLLVGLAAGADTGGGGDGPPLLVVLLAAAVAINALVLPGVSGSFFLLAVGLYGPTLAAVDDRDLAYVGVFAAGAAVGLALFVPVLRWALTQHRRTTLLVMAGLMVGSLRALWPWQSGEGEDVGGLVAPYAPVWGPVGLALLGAAVVAALIVVEARRESRDRGSAAHEVHEP